MLCEHPVTFTQWLTSGDDPCLNLLLQQGLKHSDSLIISLFLHLLGERQNPFFFFLSSFSFQNDCGLMGFFFFFFLFPQIFPLRESSVLFHQNGELMKLTLFLANFLGMVLSLSRAALPRNGCPHSSEGPVCLQIHVSSLRSAQVSSPFLSLLKPCR